MLSLPQAIRGDFRDADVESKIFSCLAAKERPSASKNVGQRQQQQHPTARKCLTMSTADQNDRTDTTTSGRDAGLRADKGVDILSSSGEAFLLRGTSASKSLLPRPEQPATDHLDELVLATTPPAPETARVAQEEADPASSLAGHGGGPHRGGLLHDQDRRARPISPASPPPSSRPLMRRANVVLSDMAPSFSGDRDTDQARVAGLVLDALAACLGDEASRRREGSKTTSVGTTTRSDGRSGRAAARGEGHGGVGSRGGDDSDVAGCCGPSIDQRSPARTGPPPPVEGIPVSSFGGTRGSGGFTVPEAVSETAASAEEPPGDGIGLLARGGTFLGKLFAGRDEREVKGEAERLFERVRVVKPPASRSGSGEMYLLATGFLLGGRKKRA